MLRVIASRSDAVKLFWRGPLPQNQPTKLSATEDVIKSIRAQNAPKEREISNKKSVEVEEAINLKRDEEKEKRDSKSPIGHTGRATFVSRSNVVKELWYGPAQNQQTKVSATEDVVSSKFSEPKPEEPKNPANKPPVKKEAINSIHDEEKEKKDSKPPMEQTSLGTFASRSNVVKDFWYGPLHKQETKLSDTGEVVNSKLSEQKPEEPKDSNKPSAKDKSIDLMLDEEKEKRDSKPSIGQASLRTVGSSNVVKDFWYGPKQDQRMEASATKEIINSIQKDESKNKDSRSPVSTDKKHLEARPAVSPFAFKKLQNEPMQNQPKNQPTKLSATEEVTNSIKEHKKETKISSSPEPADGKVVRAFPVSLLDVKQLWHGPIQNQSNIESIKISATEEVTNSMNEEKRETKKPNSAEPTDENVLGTFSVNPFAIKRFWHGPMQKQSDKPLASANEPNEELFDLIPAEEKEVKVMRSPDQPSKLSDTEEFASTSRVASLVNLNNEKGESRHPKPPTDQASLGASSSRSAAIKKPLSLPLENQPTQPSAVKEEVINSIPEEVHEENKRDSKPPKKQTLLETVSVTSPLHRQPIKSSAKEVTDLMPVEEKENVNTRSRTEPKVFGTIKSLKQFWTRGPTQNPPIKVAAKETRTVINSKPNEKKAAWNSKPCEKTFENDSRIRFQTNNLNMHLDFGNLKDINKDGASKFTTAQTKTIEAKHRINENTKLPTISQNTIIMNEKQDHDCFAALQKPKIRDSIATTPKEDTAFDSEKLSLEEFADASNLSRKEPSSLSTTNASAPFKTTTQPRPLIDPLQDKKFRPLTGLWEFWNGPVRSKTRDRNVPSDYDDEMPLLSQTRGKKDPARPFKSPGLQDSDPSKTQSQTMQNCKDKVKSKICGDAHEIFSAQNESQTHAGDGALRIQDTKKKQMDPSLRDETQVSNLQSGKVDCALALSESSAQDPDTYKTGDWLLTEDIELCNSPKYLEQGKKTQKRVPHISLQEQLLDYIKKQLPGLTSVKSIREVTFTPERAAALGYSWVFSQGYSYPISNGKKGNMISFKAVSKLNAPEAQALRKALDTGALRVELHRSSKSATLSTGTGHSETCADSEESQHLRVKSAEKDSEAAEKDGDIQYLMDQLLYSREREHILRGILMKLTPSDDDGFFQKVVVLTKYRMKPLYINGSVGSSGAEVRFKISCGRNTVVGTINLEKE